MLPREISAPDWRTFALGGVVLAASLSAAQREAHACGQTPVEVQALLPLEGASDVPLNAVLISSSNVTEAVFELHQVVDAASEAPNPFAAPPADAGVSSPSGAIPSTAVALSVDCDAVGEGSGAVCLARPIEPLKPNTRYAWHTNVAVPDGYAQEYFGGLTREFTTGTALDERAIAADALSLVVTEDHRDGSEDGSGYCGPNDWMVVAYSLAANEPGVLHFEGYTPSYVMHATLLAGGSGATTTATLYDPPSCLVPVLFDAAGHRTTLPEWCPPDAMPPEGVDEAATDAPMSPPSSSTSPTPNVSPVAARRERPLCTLSMPPSPASHALPIAAALGLALLLVERRRRRS